MERKPNILIFNPDQMRADALHHLGNAAAYTPYLDALATEGVSFSNAFCQNPVCVPSRCSFMTGLYPHVNGHRTMNYLLHSGEDNLFLDLKRQGYYTISSTRGDLLAGDERDYHEQCVDRYIQLAPQNGGGLNELPLIGESRGQTHSTPSSMELSPQIIPTMWPLTWMT